MKQALRSFNVLHTNRSLRVDGVVNVVLRNLTHRGDAGFRHWVCSLINEDHFAPAYRAAGYEPIFLNHKGITTAPRSFWRLLRLLKRLDIDLVHTNRVSDLVLVGLAAKMRGIPVVASIHWLAHHDADTKARRWQRARRMATVLALRLFADRIVAVSDAVRASFSQQRLFPRSRTHVVYPGLNVGDRNVHNGTIGRRTREKLGINGATPLILNVGRLDPAKGQRYLMPMMAFLRQRHPDAELLIAGGGPLHNELAASIAEYGLQNAIHLLGPRSDVDDLIAASDVLVLASDTEAAPLPLLEAMRAAKPIVATRVGGVPEMVHDGVNGFVVPAGDARAMASAVSRLFSDGEDATLAAEMGKAGRKIAEERFDISQSVNNLEQIYRALLEPMHASTPFPRAS